ncbi:MAG: dicarboxylate/amino acid:cation symporter [Candidatus Methylacidiphilales bacterium]
MERRLRLSLPTQILMALGLAIPFGAWVGPNGTIFGVLWTEVFDYVGGLFLNALKMITVPLVFAAVASGLASMREGSAFARLGFKTVAFYLGTCVIAVLIGLVCVNLIRPGLINGEPARELLTLSPLEEATRQSMEGRGMAEVAMILHRAVPENVLAAASDNRALLSLILFSVLFGYFLSRAEGPNAGVVRQFIAGLFEVMMLLTTWIMKFLPVGAFALVAKVAATTGWEAIAPMAMFFFTVLAALGLHSFVVIPFILWRLGGVSPLAHYRAVGPALLTAFFTSSSSATLPTTLSCLENRAGVSKEVTHFVVPLGATVNMNGTALYECVAVLFLAQAYGLELTIGVQVATVLLAVATSIGVAGIPAASLVAIVIILNVIGVPASAIGVLMITDRLLDMARTMTNVLGDTAAAVVIARSEGEATTLCGSGNEAERS